MREESTAASTTSTRPGRRLRWAPLPAALLAFAAASSLSTAADAQPSTRGAPTLRTPQPGTSAAPAPTPPVPPGPGAGTPPPAPPVPAPPAGQLLSPGAGGKPPVAGGGLLGPGFLNADDPMSSVKQGMKEIEFKPKNAGFLVSFNLDDADLPELVKAISNITGKRFIYGGKLRQIKATVYAPEKITVGEAYSAFLSILETNGLTVIPHGRFLKIIETPGIAAQTTPIVGTATPVPDEDRFITRLYRLGHVDANDVSTVLTKFKSKDGDISVYGAGNLLIITDTGTNIQRMLRIVEELDVGGAGELLWVEPIHYGAAADIATKLNEVLDLKAGAASAGAKGAAASARVGGPRIIADDRTNSLIMTATEADYRRLLELIKRLDVPPSGDGQIHVLPLQHAACPDLSATLNQILGGSSGGGAARAASAPRAGARASAGAAAAGGAPEDIFEGQIRVTCDEATNSLVTTSSLRDYAQLRSVIDQLDQPRRQVFIEAVVMDVNVSRSSDVGIGYHAGTDFDVDGNPGFVYGGNKVLQSASGLPQNLEALALGVRGPEIEGSQNILGTGLSIPALGVVMHALANDGDSNVLATPHILATDNIPAEISIGQNIPLQKNLGGLGGLGGLAGGAAGAAGAGAAGLGALGALGGLGGGFSSPRQDVGTKIKVIAHVNDSDQVRLELTEEISEQGSTEGTLGAVSINKRTANTTLIVRDQQTVVIGGLVRDGVTNSETKIPILGDIPVLGFLFRQSKKATTKTNLLLILTPYVIRDQDDLRSIFERKMQERQEFLDRYFVFNDSGEWSPPQDYMRTNGLVEEIRQTMFREDERRRLEEEARPKGARTHEPGEPIAMPTVGSAASASSDAGEAAPAAAGAKANPKLRVPPGTPGTNPATPTPALSNPATGAKPVPPSPTPRSVERVE
jgi:general secretion pathway protein D